MQKFLLDPSRLRDQSTSGNPSVTVHTFDRASALAGQPCTEFQRRVPGG